MNEKKIICWWSGGVTSALACHLAIKLYGLESCRFIMIDTLGNEDDDTYRFKKDCEIWYGAEIEVIRNDKHKSIQDVWRNSVSLNVANGAICSATLKRNVRKKWETANKGTYKHQVFGFDINETNRAKAMTLNYPKALAIYPLLMYGISKKNCIDLLGSFNILIPRMYHWGLKNNNCGKTGCVQGGIGYWQWHEINRPSVFNAMAQMEHELTDKKGSPVTMLKDQSKGGGFLFLKPHINYPMVKSIKDKKQRKIKPLFECNGFCGLNDLEKPNETYNEIAYTVNSQLGLF